MKHEACYGPSTNLKVSIRHGLAALLSLPGNGILRGPLKRELAMELIGEVAFVIAIEEFWIINKKDERGRRNAYLRGVINSRRPGLLACRTV